MNRSAQNTDSRFAVIAVVFLLITLGIISKLFILQIIEHGYYATLALNTREIYRQLYPERGKIFFKDARTDEIHPAAINRDYHQIFAVPKEIEKEQVASTTKKLTEILAITDLDEIKNIENKLSKQNDPYEPVAKKIDDDIWQKIQELNMPGIYSSPEEWRYYPEKETGSSILGFARREDERQVGNYGIEGYWNKTLAGQEGFLLGEKSALGSIISLAGQTLKDAQPGSDIILTIDRALETELCSYLRDGLEEYQAKSAALVLMNPQTGAILAMCSAPDFDPNNYSAANEIDNYNNTTIFTPYEPGSVFKPITVAMAIDQNLTTPNSYFDDPCQRKIDGFTIKNAMQKCYGTITMTEALENSVNTAMIYLEEKMGSKNFLQYVKKFGFGEKTGLRLNTEEPGNISSLEKTGQVYGAVASFGQGITVTPLQIAVAYSAIANGGKLPKPIIVSEIQHPNGQTEKTTPQTTDTVVSARAAKLTAGMMVSVIESTHGQTARLNHYFMAGKTGTAQIAGPGGYTEETNHTFAGFGPAEKPELVLVVKYESPQRQWAESTASLTFKKSMDFALKYLGLTEER
ncbi:MAG: hypothetical protein A2538_02105 [Candidatus Magasanikbacteria bacterium RIFOXYD2_FULL_41_14]|uniref:Penicillin-binding protein transpeptidase domain-containing protein n=1 Tax=Candidatus Magasanikbacteria bacterium RIFOXYD2_FULL_41_14 TaxID=1798709 RepID=A0A1F6PD28_9BACT|nr:MAG: hypothetical protein A2538_02105 [Candidatus Magasanikbacteria bacterium RIFOXYD2_FULL_41_14]